MWIVKVALSRPYTFIVLALLILILSPVIISRTPTDIFPNISIPVIAVAWQFTGLNPEELEGRLATGFERILTTTVDSIEHIESTTVNGQAIVKIFLQPNASLDTANAQVTAISQTALRELPPSALLPLIINYSTSSVPILQLALSGQGLSEQQLNDLGLNFLRTQLVTVPAASIPYSYGGKQRQVRINLSPGLLQSKGLSPADVVTAVNLQNLVLPSGTVKIGSFEYDVELNSSPRTVADLNDLPIKQVGNSTIYLRDVGQVSDGFAPQTNIVRQDGRRGTLLTILKAGNASTLDVVQGIRNLLPRVAATLPPKLNIQPLADQAIFVRAAVSGVIREAIITACLTGLMILIFLGSWRSTLIIAVSNSILVVSFARERLTHHGNAVEAAIDSGFTRFGPVLMTALAMIIGTIPMALGLGEGGEQNASLGSAVIGGLLCATVATLIFVPAVFSVFHGRRAPADALPQPESDNQPIHG